LDWDGYEIYDPGVSGPLRDLPRRVSQARISKIEHGEISGIDVVRAYVSALGGSIDVVATIGDRSWKDAASVRELQRSRRWPGHG
jgi:hypothetical protein